MGGHCKDRRGFWDAASVHISDARAACALPASIVIVSFIQVSIPTDDNHAKICSSYKYLSPTFWCLLHAGVAPVHKCSRDTLRDGASYFFFICKCNRFGVRTIILCKFVLAWLRADLLPPSRATLVFSNMPLACGNAVYPFMHDLIYDDGRMVKTLGLFDAATRM